MNDWLLRGGCALAMLLSMTVAASENRPRLISLSPHATELVFSAGAGSQLVGVARFSDYPAAAASLPVIADALHLNREQVLQLQPDIAVVWPAGNSAKDIDWLRQQGIQIFASNPGNLQQIIDDIMAIGKLAGSEAPARQQALQLKQRLQSLQNHIPQAKLKLFFQLWQKPLMTVGGSSSLQQIFQLCGFRNIFAEVQRSAFSVDPESVLAGNPQVIVASMSASQQGDSLAYWSSFSSIAAVASEQIFFIDPDISQRPTARQFDAAEYLCGLQRQLTNQ
ncbi:MAG: cobalamin-binding protein [gamma proteobacterium symbiont of Bathyaustriella thionipta]|nr:cobalamin-binding protein [gamma proteobacterium symbiont of Bathyaustriella thionipta]